MNRQPAGTRFVADFNHFWSTLEFNNYLNHLLANHNDICSTEVVGFSFQGQLIRALSVSLRGRGQIDGSRPIVFVDAGIHAREWATQTTAIHMIHQLVERRNEHLNILNNVDFVFLPITNPDGYEHSRLNVSWKNYNVNCTHENIHYLLEIFRTECGGRPENQS